MFTRDDIAIHIRKLRKKLRQIEHLERLDRDLADEELLKLARKDTIRSQLQELLSECSDLTEPVATGTYSQVSHDLDTSGSLSTDFSTSVSESDVRVAVKHIPTEREATPKQVDTRETTHVAENTNNSNSSAVEIQPEPAISQPSSSSSSSSRKTKETKPASPVREHSASPPKKPKKTNEGAEGRQIWESWTKSVFQVTSLDAHNDLVTAVCCHGNTMVSASRDTTVKVWSLHPLKDIRNLGGHTGTVTDVVLLPRQQLGDLGQRLGLVDTDGIILSSSMDCSFRVWSLDTGELIRSVYTYNPVMKLAFLPELHLVVTASDGGKLELWDIETKENVFSTLAHQSAITGLSVQSHHIYTSSTEGEIKVHEIREKSLVCIFVSENLRTVSGASVSMRHIRSLGARGDTVLYGDDGTNVKVLLWKQGEVRKLANHREEFGMTDAILSDNNLVLTSAYDLDNGQGYLNVFDATVKGEPHYLASLMDDDTGRIISLSYTQSAEKLVTIVTAGTELKVWKLLPCSTKAGPDTVAPVRFRQLAEKAVDSDQESDIEFSESEGEGEAPRGFLRRGSSQTREKGWFSWCSIV